jgi:hypothetical protein
VVGQWLTSSITFDGRISCPFVRVRADLIRD